MAATTKDRITCHALDTTLGRPARGMRVRLEGRAAAPDALLLAGGGSSAPRVFESLTDDDGRVRAWLPYSSATASGDVPVCTLDDVLAEAEAAAQSLEGGASAPPTVTTTTTWTLRFDTEGYFSAAGKDTFSPEVAVSFRVRPGEHYHVPLLLSQYSYTTYRGS
jgi:5-hydroxyisourate hydrolase